MKSRERSLALNVPEKKAVPVCFRDGCHVRGYHPEVPLGRYAVRVYLRRLIGLQRAGEWLRMLCSVRRDSGPLSHVAWSARESLVADIALG